MSVPAGDATGFPCPRCGARMMVKDSRSVNSFAGKTVRRRRYCAACRYRCSTIEVPAMAGLPHAVGALRRCLSDLAPASVKALTALEELGRFSEGRAE